MFLTCMWADKLQEANFVGDASGSVCEAMPECATPAKWAKEVLLADSTLEEGGRA